MISAGMTLASGAIGTSFLRWWQKDKEKQVLDPIATLFTLAMRDLTVFEGCKPAVCQNHLYYDLNGIFQGAIRCYYKVGHDDVAYLGPAIRLFIRHWKAEKDSNLLKIVRVALSGLDKTAQSYEGEFQTVDEIIKVCKENLTLWLNSAETGDRAKILGEPDPAEVAFIAKIKELWSPPQIDFFYLQFHPIRDYEGMKMVLDTQRLKYFKLLKEDIPLQGVSTEPIKEAAAAAEVTLTF